MGPGDLAQVLRPLVVHSHPNLIVGLAPGDDAAVYLISEGQALVQTVDFFPPIVDDPYTYGAVAAANSISDVYAMGGEVAEAGGVCFRIQASAVPLIDGALGYARARQVPGGTGRNREYLLSGDEAEAAHPTGPQPSVRVTVQGTVSRDLMTLLFDPQT